MNRKNIFYWTDTVIISCLAKGKGFYISHQTLPLMCALIIIATTLVLQQRRKKLATSLYEGKRNKTEIHSV